MAKAQTYDWSKGARIHGAGKCDPDKAAEVLLPIARSGKPTDEQVAAVLAAAEDPASPLHPATGWHWDDPERAITRWRYQVALSLLGGLRQTVVTFSNGKTVEVSIPVVVQTGKETGRGGGDTHRTIVEVAADPLDRAQFLVRLLRDIEGLIQIYDAFLSEYPLVRKVLKGLRHAVVKALESPEARPS